jgi:hypothetical protein
VLLRGLCLFSGHALFDPRLAGYVEYVGVAPLHGGHSYRAYLDTGATWAAGPDVQLDAGINVGLSHGTDDYTLFAGLSFRR